MNIYNKLREMGFNPVSGNIYSNVRVWKSWYDGSVPDFHKYAVYTGAAYIDCYRYSMGMAKKVCEDWASLLLNEKVSITLEGEKEQEFVDKVLESNNFAVKGNEMQERKAALGTVAYVPRVDNITINETTGAIMESGEIKLDYCTALSIHPLTWDNGNITECAFSSVKRFGGKEYTYLQIHRIAENKEYDIENHLFEYSKEVELDSVPAFGNVPPVIHTGSKKPQFVIDRLNIANPDEDCPMGVSVFANAIDQLKGVDIAYDSYVNEFVLGKKRIMVKPEATKTIDGKPVFDPNDTIYYVLPEDSQNGSVIEQVDMTLRTAEHNAGMQDMLNVLSSKCGFGENHYKYNNGNVSTATQIVSENSSMFRTIKKHEIILENVLKDLARIILRLGNSYMNAGLNEDVEISVDFDDSIIEDKATDFNRDLQMMNAGILNDWEFRARWLNEDYKTAKKSLPRMEDMTTEFQNEVE